MNLITCTRADQLKPDLWAGVHNTTVTTLIHNLALSRAENEALTAANAKLTAEVAELKKTAEALTPKPEIIRDAPPPP